MHGPRGCTVPSCGAPARLFPGGWRCVDHAPAAPPSPPPGTTYAERIAAGTTTSYSDAIAANQARLRRIREEARAR